MISHDMNVEALQFGSRFAITPNTLGYCGKESAADKCLRCIISGDCKGVEEEFGKFIVLNPYLKTLAEISRLSPFAYPVIEAYWLGNDLLGKAITQDYVLLLKNFIKQGIPLSFVKQLRKEPPKRFIPFHLFQVLHVGVGRASGSVPFNLNSINQCMIRWGEVQKITNDQIAVNLYSLKEENSGYKLRVVRETLPLELKLVGGLKEKDTVAVHWKQIVKILTGEEIENLSFWTTEVLKSFV